MRNYKALKTASKISVRKQKVVEVEAVDEVKYKEGDDIPEGKSVGHIKTFGVEEQSREELQVVCKSYDAQTGEAQDDIVTAYTLSDVKREIDRCKSEVTKIQAKQADLEQLEKDLKAL
jgi:hypothetical protein